jgi:mRNA interferase HigB
MKVISRKTLREFWEQHPDVKQPLLSWYHEIAKAHWNHLNDLKKDFPSASILKNESVCFNIKGNNYRVIIKVNLNFQICWIRFVGSHSEYDKIDANTI